MGNGLEIGHSKGVNRAPGDRSEFISIGADHYIKHPAGAARREGVDDVSIRKPYHRNTTLAKGNNMAKVGSKPRNTDPACDHFQVDDFLA